MATKFCVEDWCDNEAMFFYETAHGKVYLCSTCAEVFEWGQNNPDANLVMVESEDEDVTTG